MNRVSYFFQLPVSKKGLRVLMGMFFAVFGIGLGHAGEETSRQDILNRIKPVGNVRVESDPLVPPSEAIKTTAVKEQPGEAIYKQYCALCHTPGLAAAPKFRDAADWQPRLTNPNRDIKALVESALKGKNIMPPKGSCADCQAEDLQHAIEYMLPR